MPLPSKGGKKAVPKAKLNEKNQGLGKSPFVSTNSRPLPEEMSSEPFDINL